MNREEVAAQLIQLRTQLEEGCGAPLQGLSLNAACFLHDVCANLGLSNDQIEKILGPGAFAFVTGHNFLALSRRDMAGGE